MKKKWLSKLAVFIAGIMAFTMLPLAACTPDEGQGQGQVDDSNYEISVVSLGGIKIPDVTVTLSSGSGVVATAKTNENGVAGFDIDFGDYTATLSDLPVGYFTADNAAFAINAKDRKYTFGVQSKVITDTPVPADKAYKTGDVMYDFTVKTPSQFVNGSTVAGKEVSLSGYLNTGDKKAVLINFWGSGCGNCATEFPVMQRVYENYKNDLAIIALDPPSAYGDDEVQVSSWQTRYNLTFDMALDVGDGVKSHFPGNAYPLSVMVDRYGVICEIHLGSITSDFEWSTMFAKYTSDDYRQDVTIGDDGSEEFVAHKPADYGKTMPSSEAIAKVLSPTISGAEYFMPDNEAYWPWEIDGDCIVPSNRKDGTTVHKSTTAILSATFTIDEGQVLAFDYKCNSHSSDTLQVGIYENNSEGGIGKSILTDSGLQTDFTTARKYIALNKGTYELAFVYFKDYTDDDGDDCVYIKNLRLENAYESNESLEVEYYAARDRNLLKGGYQIHENVELLDDGYYHIMDHKNSDGSYPLLLADFHHNTPYSRTNSIYTNYIQTKNAVFGGKDYYNQLYVYGKLASNSEIRLVPVTEELKGVLDAIAKSETGTKYTESRWLEFCTFSIHYGEGHPVGDPIKGLSHFSAFEAVEYNGTTATVNNLYYPRFLNPRGIMYKFTAKTSGAYSFRSVLTADQAYDAQDPISASAELFDEDTLLEANYYIENEAERPRALETSYDQILRTGDEYNFKLYHYLEAGETYYIMISPSDPNTIEVTIPFVVERLGDTYTVLESCTAGMYVTADGTLGGASVLPTHCQAILNSDGLYETENGTGIYADFTCSSRMFDNFTVEQLLTGYFYNVTTYNTDNDGNFILDDNGNKTTTKYTQYSETPLKENLGEPTADTPTRILTHPFELKDGDGNKTGVNLTDRFQHYYDLRDKDENSLTNGMVRVDAGLKEILELFFENQRTKKDPDEKLDPNDWMLACYFIRVISSEN